VTLTLVAVALLTACATPDPNLRIHVGINQAGALAVQGRPATLETLPKLVKSEGGSRNTWIVVATEEGVSAQTIALVKDRLLQSGYPKVMLAVARPPSIQVATSAPPAQVHAKTTTSTASRSAATNTVRRTPTRKKATR